MDCSTPGFPVHHQLLELAQIHVHRVGDVIPGGGSGKEPAYQCRRCRRHGSISRSEDPLEKEMAIHSSFLKIIYIDLSLRIISMFLYFSWSLPTSALFLQHSCRTNTAKVQTLFFQIITVTVHKVSKGSDEAKGVAQTQRESGKEPA